MIEMSFSFFSCSFLASMPESWLDGKSGGDVEIRHFSHSTIPWVFIGVMVGTWSDPIYLRQGRWARVLYVGDVIPDLDGVVMKPK